MKRSKGYKTSELLSRASSCKRRVFSVSEDKTIIKFVSSSKFNNNWDAVAKLLPWRTVRQCRDRWTYYLSPSNNLDPFSPEEDQLIVQKVNELGKKWASISKYFKGRSDNSIKNRWYSKLQSRCDIDEDGVYSLDPSKIIDSTEKVHADPAKQNQQYTKDSEKSKDLEMSIENVPKEDKNIFVNDEKSVPSLNSSLSELNQSNFELPSKLVPSFSSMESIFNSSVELQIFQNDCMLLANESQIFQDESQKMQEDNSLWDGEFIEWSPDIFNYTSSVKF